MPLTFGLLLFFGLAGALVGPAAHNGGETLIISQTNMFVQCGCPYRMGNISLVNLQSQNPHLLLLCIWRVDTCKQ